MRNNKLRFFITIKAYHYNSGSSDNGYQLHEIDYDSEELARTALNIIKRNILNKNGNRVFKELHLGWDGVAERVDGVYKQTIVTEKV